MHDRKSPQNKADYTIVRKAPPLLSILWDIYALTITVYCSKLIRKVYLNKPKEGAEVVWI